MSLTRDGLFDPRLTAVLRVTVPPLEGGGGEVTTSGPALLPVRVDECRYQGRVVVLVVMRHAPGLTAVGRGEDLWCVYVCVCVVWHALIKSLILARVRAAAEAIDGSSSESESESESEES